MKKCKYVVVAHGAGLTNMLFMEPGGKILEFRLENNPQCFVSLAGATGQLHHSIPWESTRKSGSAHWSDMRVDADALDSALASILEE